MNIRIIKLDLTETNVQLARIADLLDGILGATDPMPATADDFPDNANITRAFYTDDKAEIVDHWVRKFGRNPKPRE